jgi:hypothetical protein
MRRRIPLCPNCSQPMNIALTIPAAGREETNVYECKACHVAFVTEDHTPVTGPTVLH